MCDAPMIRHGRRLAARSVTQLNSGTRPSTRTYAPNAPPLRADRTADCLLACLLILVTWPALTHAASSCSLARLNPQGSIFEVQGLQIGLGEAENSQGPRAWQGPLSIKQDDALKCVLDLNIIEVPLAVAAERYLYVPTYSGSERQLHAVDVHACALVWSSEVFFGTYQIEQNQLLINGKAVPLGEDCLPGQRSASTSK